MRAIVFGLLPLLAACGGPSVGEIVAQEVTLTLSAYSSDSSQVAIGEQQGGLGVTRAFVAASALSLVPCAEGASSIVLDARGYDLLTNPSEGVTTAVTNLCALELDLDPVDGAASPGVPDGSTLFVRARDSADTSLHFSSERSSSLRFEAADDNGFPSSSLILGFDVATWLAHLPVAEPDMTDTESGLLHDQLPGSVALFVDTNLNQELDDDETTPIAQASTR